uniref:Amine oxidase n=1 Tax=Physcomitrium patens TaxID=3218 RepID=A0A2K1K7D2_PHYPA|nr:hypothetical protein PHYPA_011573 [Physcomitrium patens]
MASHTKSQKIRCLSSTSPLEDFDSDMPSTSSSESSPLGSNMARGGPRPQPASGEVSVMMEEHINQQDHHRNLKVPFESLDPAVTIAGSALKGAQMLVLRTQSVHPLEPLSPTEIAVAVATVRAAGETPQASERMRFVEVVLNEPDKRVVAVADAYFFPPYQPMLDKPKGKPSMFPTLQLPYRQARLVVYNKRTNVTSVWVVELSEDAVEYAECEATVKEHASFIEAMKRRGIEDMDRVMVDLYEVDSPSRRLARPLVFCRTESDCPLENGYARPVEGIHVLVDMQKMQVIEFEDRYLVPLPPPDPLRNYTPASSRRGVDRSDVKPLLISQPQGPSFRVNGYAVEWQKWNFRVGFTPREGLVIHTNDYGKICHSLKRGCDCLGLIKYFDAHFTNFHGGVETIENCVCMHEDHGVLWKHQDWRTGSTERRRSRRLTVSFFCTVANYEYGFYWHFYQDGNIESEVKLTGILSLSALDAGETRRHGTVIAPGLYAPVHQHFFVARLDMDVDCKPGEGLNQINNNGFSLHQNSSSYVGTRKLVYTCMN